MATKTPFMVHGPKNFILNLRKLGFKTFDRWWDEGYSEDYTDGQVVHMIRNIDYLAGLSTKQLSAMYEEMKPVLDHNHEVFMKLNLRQPPILRFWQIPVQPVWAINPKLLRPSSIVCKLLS